MTRMLRRLFWMAVGAAGAYLLDPVSGRSRRAKLRDQMAAQVRSALDTAAKQARYEIGRAKGTVYEMVRSDAPPATDTDLLQKVRSEALGRVPGSTAHIDLSVEDGVVILRGTSKDRAQERELARRIDEVTGVRAVRDELVGA